MCSRIEIVWSVCENIFVVSIWPRKTLESFKTSGKAQPMDKKFPTIEALDAGFKAHYETKSTEDHKQQATWFLDAINKSELLKREILQTLHAIRNQAGMDPKQFCMSPEDVSQWILQISARFFFIGWAAREAKDDRDKQRHVH
jgi:hypothetical protein